MSLQLYPAPPFLSNTPFCGQQSTYAPLDIASPVQAEQVPASLTSSMNSRSQGLNLDGATLGPTTIINNNNNNPSPSPSPGVQSASVIMSASPYSNPPTTTSSKQTSDTPLERESKRPRIVRSHSGAISGASPDMSDQTEHHSIDGAHEHLVNYPQTASMVSQSSSSMGVVASSTMPNDTYPVVGTAYWTGNSLGADVMDKSVSEDGSTNTGMGGPMPGGGAQPQIYGSGVPSWGGQDISMPMNPMQQYVPRQLANGSWDPELPHHPHHQHPSQQHPHHQHMLPDGSLASPYESSSAATSNANPHIYGDSSFVNGPGGQQQQHRIVPPNAYEPSGGLSTPTTPHHAPAWPQTTFHGMPGSSSTGNRLVPTGMPQQDLKPKILTSSGPPSLLPRKSPSQRAATPPKPKATNSGSGSGSGSGGGGGGSTAAVSARGTVLSKATEYIQQLEQANRIMMSEHQQLVDRLRTLEAMLHSAGARPPPPPPPQPYSSAGSSSNHMHMFDPRGFS
ncbi:Helix-loop-helix DNA-binding protein [Cordyceps fumosorosea ARSEF 2679]|uniref:Helix-loop-helix DNA-binding protein n=1 Tax=Cordyceps fumosorosea (strain ARSEF 2679) TaxID=1081104 RepID=A0A167WI89_CORFA|nr:Helix-loop-helix DNA-binding protein [Cordyceps fumosorosea ARSEF 2679]OAA63824.1 Helix-loop-helix DNA-binding protein [Cordyceps fumosorosea ARSEF 2679]